MRSRIKEHRIVRAGDLIPHELNARVHTEPQRQALRELLDEVGFARSLVVYPLPDGRLKLIDGHLRRDMDPESLLTVEVLDVDDDEARALLLALDPLAQLAGRDDEVLDALLDRTATAADAIHGLWLALEQAQEETEQNSHPYRGSGRDRGGAFAAAEDREYAVIVSCESEQQQRELLQSFQKKGLACTAKIS